MEKQQRELWADLLKIVSIFCVILIHSAAPLLVRYEMIGRSSWWAANLYNSFARWCIPVFFMVSGAFLIERASKDSLYQFFRRRFQRIAIPFVLWSGVYYVWRIYGNGEDLSFTAFPLLLLREPVYYHLWFMYILIELYLLAPLLGAYVQSAGTGNRALFIILWVLFGSVLPFAEDCCNLDTFFSIGVSNTVLNYVGYFLLGYLLRDYKAGALMILILCFLFLLAWTVTAYGTFYTTVILNNGGEFIHFFYDYYSVNVLIMSVSVYIIVKSISIPWAGNFRFGRYLIITIAACTPGIYLVHALVLAVLKRGMAGIILSETSYHPAIGIPIFALAIFAGSFLVVIIITRIPLLKYTVP